MQAPSEALFLAQIVLLLLVGRLIGEAMQRIGQAAIMGQLIAGILLGPSLFGAIWPEAQRAVFAANPQQQGMIDGVSQLGILMLLLLTGMETDLRLVKQARRAAIGVSVAGIVVPFACGFALGEVLPTAMLPKPDQRIVTSLFLGTALSIASLKIVAMVVREMGFMRRKVGMALIASAIIDDTVGWVIISITLGLAFHGQVDALALGQSVLGTAIFLVASFTLGRRLVFGIIRWTNDNFVSEVPVVTAILVIMGTMALITHGASLAAEVCAARNDVNALVLWDPVIKGEDYLADLDTAHLDFIERRTRHFPLPPTDVRHRACYPFPEKFELGLRKLDLTSLFPELRQKILIVITERLASCGDLLELGGQAGARFSVKFVSDRAPWRQNAPGWDGVMPTEAMKEIANWLS